MNCGAVSQWSGRISPANENEFSFRPHLHVDLLIYLRLYCVPPPWHAALSGQSAGELSQVSTYCPVKSGSEDRRR